MATTVCDYLKSGKLLNSCINISSLIEIAQPTFNLCNSEPNGTNCYMFNSKPNGKNACTLVLYSFGYVLLIKCLKNLIVQMCKIEPNGKTRIADTQSIKRWAKYMSNLNQMV